MHIYSYLYVIVYVSFTNIECIRHSDYHYYYYYYYYHLQNVSVCSIHTHINTAGSKKHLKLFENTYTQQFVCGFEISAEQKP